ncbi:hypothetical protein [Nonomuraea sp. JJY05]|uniref:hypothetical protein n=1 Tax=Nonomuraea sp. JJY05 TaxID=3350255 RepID=UPI00373F4A80
MLADPQPVIDIVDDIVPNTSVLSNLLPNTNVSPSLVCIPTASNINSVKGNRNQTSNSQTNNCTQSAQTTTPPSNGGLAGYQAIEGTPFTVAPRTIENRILTCPAGKVVLSGGYALDASFRAAQPDSVSQVTNRRLSDTTWEIGVYNGTDQNITVHPEIICATAP